MGRGREPAARAEGADGVPGAGPHRLSTALRRAAWRRCGQLGFGVALLGAEVGVDEGGFGPPFDHMALLVTLGAQRWLVDVGFGDSFVLPLDLDQLGEQRQGRGVYALHLDDAWQVLTKRADVEGSIATPSYRFQTRPREVTDFEPMYRQHQTSAAGHRASRCGTARALRGRVVKLVALSGSLRAGSFSTAAPRAALAIAQRGGVQTSLCDLRETDLPLFRPEAPIVAYPRATRAHVERLVAQFRDADLMLRATPTYHGSMSGALKNALDDMELLGNAPAPCLQGKAVGLIALADASPHAGMAACVAALRGWLAPTRVTLHAADFDAALALTSIPARRRMTRLVDELLHFAAR